MPPLVFSCRQLSSLLWQGVHISRAPCIDFSCDHIPVNGGRCQECSGLFVWLSNSKYEKNSDCGPIVNSGWINTKRRALKRDNNYVQNEAGKPRVPSLRKHRADKNLLRVEGPAGEGHSELLQMKRTRMFILEKTQKDHKCHLQMMEGFFVYVGEALDLPGASELGVRRTGWEGTQT